MHYLIVFQVLCGFFAAHVASRNGRNAVGWWFAGALLPVLGVVAVMLAGRKEGGTSMAGTSTGKDRRVRPSRCCGEFLPDCRGCPYFRRRLFRSEDGDAVGYCTFYDRILRENRPRDGQGSDARGETVSTGDGSR